MRTKKQISKKELTEIINQLEAQNTFVNPSQLYQAVIDTEWGQMQGVSAATIYMRVKEYNIPIKTKPGKRSGNPNLGGIRGPKGPRVKKKDKFAQHPEAFAALRKHYPAVYHGLINNLEKGSARAAQKLKCLDCAGFIRAEIKWCKIQECSLWLLRPYQPKPGETEPLEQD